MWSVTARPDDAAVLCRHITKINRKVQIKRRPKNITIQAALTHIKLIQNIHWLCSKRNKQKRTMKLKKTSHNITIKYVLSLNIT